MKMKGKVYRSCVRAAMVYGSETWVMKKEEEGVLLRAERAMVRMMCGAKLRDRKSSKVLMAMVSLNEDIVTLVRRSRLRWYGHVMRRDEWIGIKKVLEFEAEGVRGRGRPRVEWKEQVEKDMMKLGLKRDDVWDRNKWRRVVHQFS